jgi:hypothetical protein
MDRRRGERGGVGWAVIANGWLKKRRGYGMARLTAFALAIGNWDGLGLGAGDGGVGWLNDGMDGQPSRRQ